MCDVIYQDTIYQEVDSIAPLDALEAQHQTDVLSWIASGAELCRLDKPAVPAQHLVSYFVLVDGKHVLLVDHKKAKLWLPTGGHVEPGEHPRDAALREVREELGISPALLQQTPLMLTKTQTVGLTTQHVDVSLWYVMQGDRSQVLDFDQDEFNSIAWFHHDDIPVRKSDPHMSRFITKLRDSQGII